MLYKIGSPIYELHLVDPRRKTAGTKKAIQKYSKRAISELDLDTYVYHDVAILHSVLLKKDSDFLIRKNTEQFINANDDCWSDEELLDSHKTFIGVGTRDGRKKNADVFVEHVQVKELSKGTVFDVVASRQGPLNIVGVNLLIGTEKKHDKLIKEIDNGTYNAVSMGCSVDHVLCTVCGTASYDDYNCQHLLYQQGAVIPSIDGKVRKCAELCIGSDFYDCSWVKQPADHLALVQERIA